MDPLSALSLAANVIQFVEVGVKLVSVGSEIRQSGSSSLIADLSLIAKDITDVNLKLKSSVKPSSLFANVSEDDRALETLSDESVRIGDDLIKQLEALKLDPNQSSRWRSVPKTLKSVWKEEKLKNLASRLEAIRGEVEFRLVAITKGKVDAGFLAMDDRFARLDFQSQKIIQTLLKSSDATAAAVSAHTAELHQRHDRTENLVKQLHQETLEAMQNLNVSAPMMDLGPPPTDLHDPAAPKIELSETQVRRIILDALKYKQMFERESDVSVAHPETFGWILDRTASSNATYFSPLQPWLESDNGCYWISGKAGSGKSTLMKKIGKDRRTHDGLQKWSGGNELIVASFYFWRSGTVLQRSQAGLLRWLLLTILSQRQDLIRMTFPEAFNSLKEGEWESPDPMLTLDALQNAFLRLSMQSISALRVFLLVDGVDEFEGDHAQISEFFRQIGRTPNFKLLISSRPVAACVAAFQDCPSLRLQDLTRGDIKSYVESTIGNHEHMRALRVENGREVEELLNSILTKASGVFLWVKLVVKSLLEGMTNYDRIIDLQERVNEIPSELEELYMHMFRGMDRRYQRHAAQLLQLVAQSVVVQTQRPLTVLQLSFADDGDPSKALQLPMNPLEPKEIQVKCETMAGRLKTRCCGLVEVVVNETQGSGREYTRDEVHVLHESVLAFLHSSGIWSTLTAMTPKFDSNQLLLAACVSEMKVMSTRNPRQCLRSALMYAHVYERFTTRSASVHLDEMLKVIMRRQDLWIPPDIAVWVQPTMVKDMTWQSVTFLPGDRQARCLSGFWELCAYAGIPGYLKLILERYPQQFVVTIDPVMVMSRLLDSLNPATVANGYVYKSFGRGVDPWYEQNGEVIQLLLEQLLMRRDQYRAALCHAWSYVTDVLTRWQRSKILLDWRNDYEQFICLRTLLRVTHTFIKSNIDLVYVWQPFNNLKPVSLSKVTETFLETWLRGMPLYTGKATEEVSLDPEIDAIQEVLNSRPKFVRKTQWPVWLPEDLVIKEQVVTTQSTERRSFRKFFLRSKKDGLHSRSGLVHQAQQGPFEIDSDPNGPTNHVMGRLE